MEVSRAIADLEEVRTRLAAVQRFRGLSGGAAFASGVAAIGSGFIQAASVPQPATPAEGTLYVTLWIACLVCSLVVNYGAIVLWLVRHWSVRSRVELKTVGMTILPRSSRADSSPRCSCARGRTRLLPGAVVSVLRAD